MLGVITSGVTAFLLANALTGFPGAMDYTDFIAAGEAPDILHERAYGWEALFGNPYRPVGDVMSDHGYPAIDGGISVRTPAALLLQTSLLLVPESLLLISTVSIALILLSLALRWTFDVSQLKPRTASWLGPAFFVSIPAVMTVLLGSVMALLPAVLVLAAWKYRDDRWAGILLGLAAASRLWPLLVILGFLIAGRRRATVEATTSFALFTVAGLFLPGVTLDGTLGAVLGGGDSWIGNPQNVSLAHAVAPLGVDPWIVLAIVSAAGLWFAIRSPRQAIPVTVLAALVASPLSWPTYAICAFPALADWGRTTSAKVSVAMVAAPWLGWILIPSQLRGIAMGLSLVGLLVVVICNSNQIQEHEHIAR